MKPFIVKIKQIRHITHDILQIVTGKPPEYTLTPGQATEVSVYLLEAVPGLLLSFAFSGIFNQRKKLVIINSFLSIKRKVI